jgi:hypothetical protein
MAGVILMVCPVLIRTSSIWVGTQWQDQTTGSFQSPEDKLTIGCALVGRVFRGSSGLFCAFVANVKTKNAMPAIRGIFLYSKRVFIELRVYVNVQNRFLSSKNSYRMVYPILFKLTA